MMTAIEAILVTPVVTALLAAGSLVAGAAIAAVVMASFRPGRRGGSVRDPSSVESDAVTEQRERDRNALAGDSRVERALRALPIGVVVTDPTGRTVYRNAFAAQFEHARHGEALVEAALQEVIAVATGGRSSERTIDLYGPPARNLQLRGSPLHDADVLTGAAVLIEDVSAAHQIDRVRKDFVANVSHELRTPIGAIGVLAETLGDASDREVVERLSGRLQDEAMRLGGIIDDLLALSKLESGPIDADLVDLHEVVKVAVGRTAALAEQRDIHIKAMCSDSDPVFVDGDQAQLVSAVVNLLDNAIKYSPDGNDAAVDVDRSGDDAVVVVTDSGVGIPGGDLARIFERFYRVDAARSRATGGTGLGLAIVRHVAINHGGTISVDSVEGQGSTFTLRLPLSTVRTVLRSAG